MSKQSTLQDRNFDGLAERFQKNIYSGLKGAIRLAVLERDFARHLPFIAEQPMKPLRVLDAGGGQGQFSLQLARAGHELVICDISADMLALAQTQVSVLGLNKSVTLLHCSIQQLPEHLADCQFDLVLCHAVMEWLAEPQQLLPCLQGYLKQGGYLSLTYYNRHALIYKNLLRGNYKKVMTEDFNGARGSLTPINPIDIQVVDAWVVALGFERLCSSGIRVFHDYIFDRPVRECEPQQLIAMELQFSQLEPYRSLGRYIHLLLKKNNPLSL
jgi:S-adenosylmethionine-dependent methyltransferase